MNTNCLSNPLEHRQEYFNYHDQSRNGFFALLTKRGDRTSQRSYPLDKLSDVVRLVDTKIDTYASQAEFYRPNRRLVSFKRISVSFLDLDTYNTDYKGCSHEYLVGAILFYCNDNGIPIPSAIMSSGRGYYLKWYFTCAIPAKVLPRWNALQSTLCGLFSEFGADSKATDASRVLRLEGTVNSKSGTICQVIWSSSETYDFESLCTEILPVARDVIQDQRAETAAQQLIRQQQRANLQLVQGGGLNPNLMRFSSMRLNWDRLNDLRLLVAMRGGQVPEGSRDLFLFLAVSFLAHCVAPGTLKIEVHQLAKEFVPDLTKSQVIGYTSSAIRRADDAAKQLKVEFNGQKRDPRYMFKNATLIELLEIVPAEERQLQTIISECESKERDRARKADARKAAGARPRSEYFAARTDKQADKQSQAIDLRSQGMKIKAIAKTLNVDKRTIMRYLSQNSRLV